MTTIETRLTGDQLKAVDNLRVIRSKELRCMCGPDATAAARDHALAVGVPADVIARAAR